MLNDGFNKHTKSKRRLPKTVSDIISFSFPVARCERLVRPLFSMYDKVR